MVSISSTLRNCTETRDDRSADTPTYASEARSGGGARPKSTCLHHAAFGCSSLRFAPDRAGVVGAQRLLPRFCRIAVERSAERCLSASGWYVAMRQPRPCGCLTVLNIVSGGAEAGLYPHSGAQTGKASRGGLICRSPCPTRFSRRGRGGARAVGEKSWVVMGGGAGVGRGVGGGKGISS